MMKRLQRELWAESYFLALWRMRKWLNALAIILFLVSLRLITRLELKPSFSQLLPQNLQSVQQADALAKRFGGSSKLLVAIEGPNFQANKKFSEALATKLKPLEGTLIRYFDYRYQDVQNYFETYGLHYLDTRDLFRTKATLLEEITKQKDKAVGSFLGLDSLLDDTPASKEPAPHKVSGKDLMSTLDPGVQRFLSYPDAYLGSDNGHLLVINLMAKQASLSQKESSILSQTVKGFIDELKPETFDPRMKVSLSGNVQKTLDELSTIKHDIADTSLLLVALILAVLIVFFSSFRWITLLLVNLILGTAITFGLTQVLIGTLNTMTAFLSSLVAGTGINYGIILISRYMEERKRTGDVKGSIVQSISSTALGTLLGSSTCAASFMCLLTADNKGFSQFGVIGGMGVLICWIAAYTLLPIWIYQWELRSLGSVEDNRFMAFFRRRMAAFGEGLFKNWTWVLVLLAVISSLGISGVSRLFDDPLEYDFSKLRNRDSGNVYGPYAVEKRIQKDVYNSSLSPAYVLLDSVEQAKELCPRVKSLVESLPPDRRVFESCLTMYELLPKPPVSSEEAHLREKLRLDIQKIMGDRWLKFSDSKAANWMAALHEKASQKTPELKDIPETLLRRFEDLSGARGFIGLIYPPNNKPLEDGRNLLNFTRTFRHIWLPKSDTVVSAAGENFILADLLRGIRIDGPRCTLFAFISVLVLAFLLTGSLRSGILMSTCILVGIWWVLVLQGLVGIKYNFLNFIALPLTFGIGVDYPINLFLRMRELEYKKFGLALSTTGVAVILCSLTTVIGYVTLLGASNQALVSFAELALYGEWAALASAILLLPLVIRFLQSASKKKSKESIFQLDAES